MTGRRDSFSKLDVTVTMTGEEWFTLLSRLVGRDFTFQNQVADPVLSRSRVGFPGVVAQEIRDELRLLRLAAQDVMVAQPARRIARPA